MAVTSSAVALAVVLAGVAAPIHAQYLVCSPDAFEATCADAENVNICQAVEIAKCCVDNGGAVDLCCDGETPEVQALDECQEVTINAFTPQVEQDICDPEVMGSACYLELEDAAWTECYNLQQVQCCVSQGNAPDVCCAPMPAAVRAQAVCATTNAADMLSLPCEPAGVEAACQSLGCEGAACTLCYEERYLQCCVQALGMRAECCQNLSPTAQAGPLCQEIALDLQEATPSTTTEPAAWEEEVEIGSFARRFGIPATRTALLLAPLVFLGIA